MNLFKRLLVIGFVFGLVGFAFAADSKDAEKRSRFLLLDTGIIDYTENAKVVVGTVEKHKANPLFGEDNPWEKRFDNLYGNVIFDEEENIYKCWYSPFTYDYSSKGMTLKERDKKYKAPRGRTMSVCYATSKDGIKWDKPALGKVEYPAPGKEGYNGDKNNNIVWRGPHGAGVTKDLHDKDPNRRYKMMYKDIKKKLLMISFSPDGINWSEPEKCLKVKADTHNNVLWAPTLGKYVGISRTWDKRGKGRQVARIESDDCIDWSDEKIVLEGISRDQQTYAMPVFYYGGVYLGLIAVHEQSSDRVWGELAWSPDTINWHRVSPGTPLIPCSDDKLEYDYGCVYPSAYPVFLEDEVRLYYGGSDWLHYGWRNGFLALATMRPDGFAGYEQMTKKHPAMAKTEMIEYDGKPIQISADVAKSGYIKVTVQNEEGDTIATAKTVTKTVTDEPLKLNKKIDADKIRLVFDFNNAKIYSFSYGD